MTNETRSLLQLSKFSHLSSSLGSLIAHSIFYNPRCGSPINARAEVVEASEKTAHLLLLLLLLLLLYYYYYYYYYYWEYKLVRSVFLCIYFKTKWMNRWIKVLSIAAYYFFQSLRQFSNSISKKWLVFGGDSILEPIFILRKKEVNQWLAKSCCILRNNQ